MSLFLSFPFSLGESDNHILKVPCPTTQHFQDMDVTVSKGRVRWLKLQVILAEEKAFTVMAHE